MYISFAEFCIEDAKRNSINFSRRHARSEKYSLGFTVCERSECAHKTRYSHRRNGGGVLDCTPKERNRRGTTLCIPCATGRNSRSDWRRRRKAKLRRISAKGGKKVKLSERINPFPTCCFVGKAFMPSTLFIVFGKINFIFRQNVCFAETGKDKMI